MKRIAALLIACCLLVSCISAQAEEEPLKFAVRHGSREVAKVAITIDDCYDRESLRKAFELCQRYGVPATVFPIGDQLMDEDAELWQTIAASDWEIGSHTYHHSALGQDDRWGIIGKMMRTQERLDAVLGYHYPIRSVRPPFGNYTDSNDSSALVRTTCKAIGIDHLILWDVSQTDPDLAIKKVQNGSILLYHARPKDVRCLEKLIPALLDKGYELVTVSELLGFPELATSTDLYVYDRAQFQQKNAQ